MPSSKARWLELSIQVPSEYVEPVAELFRHYGKGGVAIEEAGGYDSDEDSPPPTARQAVVRTYMPVTPAYRMGRELLHIGISLISRIHPLPPLQERDVKSDEWEEAWKEHFTLLHAGPRLVVRAPWQEYTPRVDEVVVELDPGLAFGTGHHPSTWRCLEAVERFVTPGCHVVDVGAGSGILGIAAAKLGAGRVLAVELEPIALRVCRANLRANGVSGLARCYAGTLPHPRVPPAWADLVLANINATVLINLAQQMRRVLKPGGWLVGTGILVDHRARVEQAFAAAGLPVQEAIVDDDWVALLAR